MVIERPREYLRPAQSKSKDISPELREVLHMLEVIEDDDSVMNLIQAG